MKIQTLPELFHVLCANSGRFDIKSLRICLGPQKAIPSLSVPPCARQHHRLKEIERRGGGIDSKLQGGAVTASILEMR